MCKQVTIEEFLEKNKDCMRATWIAYDPKWKWLTFISEEKPSYTEEGWNDTGICLDDDFNLVSFKGNWKNSLMKIK